MHHAKTQVQNTTSFSKTSSVQPVINGYPGLFRGGEVEGSEEKWHPTSIRP